MKRPICFVAMSIAFTTSALADNEIYQIIPYFSRNLPNATTEYEAMILDKSNGESYRCLATSKQGKKPTLRLNCMKATVASGSMPPGPGEASPILQSNAGYFGVWKVNQTNGEVTFCGTISNPNTWFCATQPRP